MFQSDLFMDFMHFSSDDPNRSCSILTDLALDPEEHNLGCCTLLPQHVLTILCNPTKQRYVMITSAE